MKIKFAVSAVCCGLCLVAASFAQTVSPKEKKILNTIAAASTAEPDLAAEFALLRKSIDKLNAQLTETIKKLAAADNPTAAATAKQNRILLNLEILSRAEQRAEVLRKQLIELSEKEVSVKSRLTQLEEDARSENVERNTNFLGSTRAPEIRENRRRQLEVERDGLKNLLNQIQSSRVRLDQDVRDADALVETLRKRVYPALKRELETNLTN